MPRRAFYPAFQGSGFRLHCLTATRPAPFQSGLGVFCLGDTSIGSGEHCIVVETSIISAIHVIVGLDPAICFRKKNNTDSKKYIRSYAIDAAQQNSTTSNRHTELLSVSTNLSRNSADSPNLSQNSNISSKKQLLLIYQFISLQYKYLSLIDTRYTHKFPSQNTYY